MADKHGTSRHTVEDPPENPIVYDPPMRIEHLFFESRKHLVKTTKLGHGIPGVLNSPPWRLSYSEKSILNNFETVQKVNQLLNYSMKIKQSTLGPKDVRISRDTYPHVGVMRHCIRSILEPGDGLPDIKLGTLLVRPEDEETFGVTGNFLTWLDFGKGDKHIPIDLSCVGREDDNGLHYMYYNRRNQYSLENPFQSKNRIAGIETVPLPLEREKYQIWQHYSTNDNVEKNVVMDMHQIPGGALPYQELMRDYMKKTFRVQPEDLRMKWKKLCWNCFKTEEGELKTCSVCKVAKYCNKDCQAKDWRYHKLLHPTMVDKRTGRPIGPKKEKEMRELRNRVLDDMMKKLDEFFPCSDD